LGYFAFPRVPRAPRGGEKRLSFAFIRDIRGSIFLVFLFQGRHMQSDHYGGADYFFLKNHLGSIAEITDIYQNTVKTYDYDAFGNILGEDGSLAHNAFTYTAREYHPRSGLYYYRARWYDPEIGRFITQDPIGFLGGMNLYVYVGNDPVTYIDPLGLWTWQRGISVTVGAGGGGTLEVGFALGHDPSMGLFNGWQFGTYQTAGVGGYGGIGASVESTKTRSTFSNIKDLSGPGLSVGGSMQPFSQLGWLTVGGELNINKEKVCGKPTGVSFTLSSGAGMILPAPFEGHGFVTRTKVQTWFEN
jgi:RHS repeat-associated protein